MTVAFTGARASQGSIIHLLRQREMEMNDCKIERLGGRITRSVIVQVSMTSYSTLYIASPHSLQWSSVLCGVRLQESQSALDWIGML